jgi:hypothetical protein
MSEKSMRLKDKVAIITGAASGFGEGMAKRFAEEGARIVVADLNAKGAERVAGEIGPAAIWTQTDVSLRSEFDEMVYAARSAFGRIDIMVNNAGYTHRNGDMLGVDEATFDLITAVNMKAIYHACTDSGADHGPARRRRHPHHGFHRRHQTPARSHLVQRVEGLGDHRDQVHGRGARAEEHPCQLPLSRCRGDRHAGEHMGADTPEIRRNSAHRSRSTADTSRHSQRRALACLGRGRLHHGVALEVDGGRCI